MSKPFIALLSILLLAPVANASSIDMRPGLWEFTTTSDLLKLVPHIPPDQMQQLLNLARQNGFDMPEIQNGAAASKVCITPEMAAKKILPNVYHSRSGCAATNETLTENRYKSDVVCAGPDLNGNGKAEGILTSSESLSGRSEFSGTVRGTPVHEQAEISGRWIGASCGSVKPLQ